MHFWKVPFYSIGEWEIFGRENFLSRRPGAEDEGTELCSSTWMCNLNSMRICYISRFGFRPMHVEAAGWVCRFRLRLHEYSHLWGFGKGIVVIIQPVHCCWTVSWDPATGRAYIACTSPVAQKWMNVTLLSARQLVAFTKVTFLYEKNRLQRQSEAQKQPKYIQIEFEIWSQCFVGAAEGKSEKKED